MQPSYPGVQSSSRNGTHFQYADPSLSYSATLLPPSYAQSYSATSSNTQSSSDGSQQRPDALAGRYSHHRYSHERTNLSSSSTLVDDAGVSKVHVRPSYWENPPSRRYEANHPPRTEASGRNIERLPGSFVDGNARQFVEQGTMRSGIHPSQQYQYSSVPGNYTQPRSQVDMSNSSMTWRYELSHSPTPTESSQYRLSPSFSIQSASSPDSLSDPPDEKPPRRRRRTKLSDHGSAASISSEASSACNSPQLGATSSSSSSRPGSRDMPLKAAPPRKARGKHFDSQKKTAFRDGPSFNVFMVKPSPALQEPSGATYMSTVDFDADAAADTFEHGPTDLPPRPYIGGPDATSPWKPRKNLGTIPGSAMDYLPVVEARMSRLENSLNAYVEYRGQKATQNAILPGLDSSDCGEEMDCDDPSRS